MEQILLSIFTLVLAIATYIFRKVIMPYVESNVKKNDLDKVIALVKIAVSAAEQIFKESKAGKNKKEYVKKYLSKMGIELTDVQLNALIEATVYELNNAKQEIKEIAPSIEAEK